MFLTFRFRRHILPKLWHVPAVSNAVKRSISEKLNIAIPDEVEDNDNFNEQSIVDYSADGPVSVFPKFFKRLLMIIGGLV